MKTTISLTIALLINSVTYGQDKHQCDTIYTLVDKMPSYDKGIAGLAGYVTKEVVPVITDCVKRDGGLISRLDIVLTIDLNGHVTDASFRESNMTDQCKDDLKHKFLAMKDWTPGRLEGRNVCTYLYLPIGCFKWSYSD
jgi:hypothetical protein